MRSDLFRNEIEEHKRRAKMHPGFWVGPNMVTGYLGQEHQPIDDGDHMSSSQFGDISTAATGGEALAATGGTASAGTGGGE